MSEPDEDVELSDAEYLRNLAERLLHIPVMFGTDGYDIDRLSNIARELDAKGVDTIEDLLGED
jgi:hypothetical protein